ncbi:MAG: hypothetical protein WCA82_02695 [Jiangellales bacterium]
MTTTRVSLGDGRLLDVLVAGSLDGPGGRVVLAHHGTPSTATSWHDWAEPLRAEGFSLVACSRPGYTGSTRQVGRRVAEPRPTPSRWPPSAAAAWSPWPGWCR